MEILSKGSMPSDNDKHPSLPPLFSLFVNALFSLQETQGLGWREVLPAASHHVKFLGGIALNTLQKNHQPRSRF